MSDLPLTPDRLAEVQSTQLGDWFSGPWRTRYLSGDQGEPDRVEVYQGETVIAVLPDWAHPVAVWMAAAHEDLPELLAEAIRLAMQAGRTPTPACTCGGDVVHQVGCQPDAAEPRIVVLCGSTEFMDDFTEANLRLTAAGRIVLSVGCNMKVPHELWADPADAEALKPVLDELHRAKIRMADEVLVVGTRIGTSTRSEIAYARELGLPVTFLHPEVDA